MNVSEDRNPEFVFDLLQNLQAGAHAGPAKTPDRRPVCLVERRLKNKIEPGGARAAGAFSGHHHRMFGRFDDAWTRNDRQPPVAKGGVADPEFSLSLD